MRIAKGVAAMKPTIRALIKHIGTLAASLAWLAAFAILAVGALADTQASELTPLGIGLEGVDYPYPVHQFDLFIQGQALRMAYMDVAPAGAANGKAIVLLHGKGFTSAYWADVIRLLAGKGYRVVAPDQIGFGKSAKPEIRYSFDLLAQNTKLLLDHLGISRAAIVGHSFGGMLAVYFARDYPEITSVLVLENPIGLEDYRAVIKPIPLATLFATEMAQTPQSYRAFMKAFFVGWPSVAEESVETFSRILKSPEYPRWAMASALTYQMIYEEPIRQDYHLLKMPVLLIIGEGDHSAFFRRYAPEAAKALGHWTELGREAVKDLPHGRLVEIEGSGHVPHIEKAAEFDTALTNFLDDNL
jgi:pimeloyl-ACP methyl ester carboxylesterase